MAKLVKIGSRILNLDQLIYARTTGEGEEREVMLMFERPTKITVPDARAAYEAQRKSGSLNLAFQTTDKGRFPYMDVL